MTNNGIILPIIQMLLALVVMGLAFRSFRDRESTAKRRNLLIATGIFIVVLIANQLTR
jgi:hypothetical protein